MSTFLEADNTKITSYVLYNLCNWWNKNKNAILFLSFIFFNSPDKVKVAYYSLSKLIFKPDVSDSCDRLGGVLVCVFVIIMSSHGVIYVYINLWNGKLSCDRNFLFKTIKRQEKFKVFKRQCI